MDKAKQKKAKAEYSSAEKKSFRNGMNCQFNKEHPKQKYGVIVYRNELKNGGEVIPGYSTASSSMHKTRAEAEAALKNAKKRCADHDNYYMAKAKEKKLSEYDSNSISTFEIVPINERVGIGSPNMWSSKYSKFNKSKDKVELPKDKSFKTSQKQAAKAVKQGKQNMKEREKHLAEEKNSFKTSSYSAKEDYEDYISERRAIYGDNNL